MAGALALVGALAGAGALLVWGCTDNSGNGKFVEPNRPFPDADGATPPAPPQTPRRMPSDHATRPTRRRATDAGTIPAPTAEAPPSPIAGVSRPAVLGDPARMPSGMRTSGAGRSSSGWPTGPRRSQPARPASRVRPFDLVEARVDLFSGQRLDADFDACARLEASGTPVLVTIRSASQGGRFAAADAERLERFRAALAVASWANVEDDAAIVDDVAARRARPGGSSSSRTTTSPPLRRSPCCSPVDRCHAAAPGAVAKVATAVKGADDRAALRTLLARRPERRR